MIETRDESSQPIAAVARVHAITLNRFYIVCLYELASFQQTYIPEPAARLTVFICDGIAEHLDKLRLSAEVSFMRLLDIRLIHHSVLQSGIDALMAQKLLYLLNRHSFVDCHRCKCPPKLVWMNPTYIKLFT